jgi:hypothetical protein
LVKQWYKIDEDKIGDKKSIIGSYKADRTDQTNYPKSRNNWMDQKIVKKEG